MMPRQMSIIEFNGTQIYKSDYTFAESITLLEIWKAKLIQEKIAAQDNGSGAAHRPTAKGTQRRKAAAASV
jgi:hypothetical protein